MSRVTESELRIGKMNWIFKLMENFSRILSNEDDFIISYRIIILYEILTDQFPFWFNET